MPAAPATAITPASSSASADWKGEPIRRLPQGAIRADKETVMREVGRTLEERLRIEAETVLSMFLRGDKHSHGAQAFLDKKLKPEWPHHGL